ncbi:hypothetical protein V8E36_003696 [Tilletia maclaganii]
MDAVGSEGGDGGLMASRFFKQMSGGENRDCGGTRIATTEGTRPRAITYVREDRLARLRVTQRQYDLAADTGDVWIGTQDWALEVEPGTPTHGVGGRSGGAALDLVFSSSKLQSLDWVTQCRTRPDLATGADHEVVWTELQARSDAHPRAQGRLALHRMDEQRFAAELHAMAPVFEPLAS